MPKVKGFARQQQEPAAVCGHSQDRQMCLGFLQAAGERAGAEGKSIPCQLAQPPPQAMMKGGCCTEGRKSEVQNVTFLLLSMNWIRTAPSRKPPLPMERAETMPRFV